MYKTILTKEYECCYKCGKWGIEWHHIIHGNPYAKRLSEETGLMVPLCHKHHEEVHHVGGELDRELKEEGQRAFLIETFGRCYL